MTFHPCASVCHTTEGRAACRASSPARRVSSSSALRVGRCGASRSGRSRAPARLPAAGASSRARLCRSCPANGSEKSSGRAGRRVRCRVTRAVPACTCPSSGARAGSVSAQAASTFRPSIHSETSSGHVTTRVRACPARVGTGRGRWSSTPSARRARSSETSACAPRGRGCLPRPGRPGGASGSTARPGPARGRREPSRRSGT